MLPLIPQLLIWFGICLLVHDSRLYSGWVADDHDLDFLSEGL